VKLLTYNLFWWSLFTARGGNNGSASKLIAHAGHAEPFDVMGFQECMDPQRVLSDARLSERYSGFGGDGSGTAATCMAFHKGRWALLARGFEYVAEDSRAQYFGRRAAQWMRLRHIVSGMTLFFVNHHGPLPINSGGQCGGAALASRLLHLIVRHAHRGDTVILLGDFNADDSSATIRHLRRRLRKAYMGVVDGGIDHVFTNLDSSAVVSRANLGAGGSDHDALSVVVELGGGREAPAPEPASRAGQAQAGPAGGAGPGPALPSGRGQRLRFQ